MARIKLPSTAGMNLTAVRVFSSTVLSQINLNCESLVIKQALFCDETCTAQIKWWKKKGHRKKVSTGTRFRAAVMKTRRKHRVHSVNTFAPAQEGATVNKCVAQNRSADSAACSHLTAFPLKAEAPHFLASCKHAWGTWHRCTTPRASDSSKVNCLPFVHYCSCDCHYYFRNLYHIFD